MNKLLLNGSGYKDRTAYNAIKHIEKNRRMANKGKALEKEIEMQNEIYKIRRQALVQKISTPWKVVRRGKEIISAYPEEKSTLDFRGTVKGGLSISFDCKESEDVRGLPLTYIKPHQINYIRNALEIGERSFIICYLKKQNTRCYIPGEIVLEYWDIWQKNKGKRNINFINKLDMKVIKSKNGNIIDYLKML